MKKVLLSLTVLVSSLLVAAESGAKNRVEWAKSLLASQEKISKMSDSGGLSPLEQGSWYQSDIMKNKGRDEALFPETKGVDLKAKNAKGKSLWKKQKKWQDGSVINFRYGGKAVVYLYREIKSRAATKSTIFVGSDDGIKIWLNGKLIHNNGAARGVNADDDKVTANFIKGKNKLLIKVNNIGGGYGFYYRLNDQISDIAKALKAQFPTIGKTLGKDISYQKFGQWLRNEDASKVLANWKTKVASRLGSVAPEANDDLIYIAGALQIEADLESVKKLFTLFKPEAFELSVKSLTRRFRDKYPNGQSYLGKIPAFKNVFATVKAGLEKNDKASYLKAKEMLELQHKALLENPEINFDEVLLVKRHSSNYGLTWNWQGNTSLWGSARNLNNEVVRLNIRDQNSSFQPEYKPERKDYVGDMTLHWDATRYLFSSLDSHGRWHIYEKRIGKPGTRQLTAGSDADIDSYDACYLPNGKILFNSTSGYNGVPCVGGSDYVGNLHVMNYDGTGIRRVCYDQDNNWYPVVKEDGRVMFLRWEYTDSAHYFSRILMSMNPDGTGQRSMYGSNSYWPSTMFYARPIPGSSSKFVAIVSGHHGVKKEGELVIFDTKKGTTSNSGAVQKIPGYGKPVEARIADNYAGNVWPRFLHPYPISDKYFLVSMRMRGEKAHGLYLVDIYDNIVLLKKGGDYCLFEARPLVKTKTPPVIPEKVDLTSKDGTLYIADIYEGPGLAGVPRGTVKKLRVFQYEYSYRNGGGHYVIGMDGPWDVRRMLGTVDVHEDGSSMFKVPANRPIAIQPLDAEGKALQIFRSWLVVMPGETLACVGCHEDANLAVPTKSNIASKNPPQTLKRWYGPVRGFSFDREVQPVLDQSCVGCHDGKDKNVPNFSRNQKIQYDRFSMAYWNLMKYVRRNGPEGDYHVLTPLEFHANTSRLIQLLEKGHHNVKLTKEQMDRLVTWIDINVPYHGTWTEATKIRGNFAERRLELKKRYSNVDENIEEITFNKNQPILPFVVPEKVEKTPVEIPKVAGWPFNAKTAKTKQEDGQCGVIHNLDVSPQMSMAFARIPKGSYVKGSTKGFIDEPVQEVTIDKPFMMSTTEITLEQYQAFDPTHKNGFYDMHYKDQVKPGYDMDKPNFPVIRVSYRQALKYCEWLGKKLNKTVTLPTENQWEWACRAGTNSEFYYGNRDTNFSEYANLADISLKKLAVRGVNPQPIRNPSPYWDWELKDDRFDDGVLHLAPVASYKPNAWGLHDMHGNVAEWTLSDYSETDKKKVTRGGSWYDRPIRARSSYRLQYPDWQRVYNVGFRVIITD